MSPRVLENQETTWRGADVTVAEVLRQLNRLRAEAARLQLGDQDHIHPRNSVLDLIVVASDPEEAEVAAAVVGELSLRHPCRAVFVLDLPGAEKGRIDASVSSISQPLIARGRTACQYEQVFLRVQGPPADHIPSLVDSLLLPDVTTYMWWTGSPPLEQPRFNRALDAAEVVLVDSARFGRPFELFTALAAVASKRKSTYFGDFHWTRLTPWREALAQFFNPSERRGFLDGVGALGIDYAATGRGNRSAAALFAGWFGSALNWRLQRSVAGKGGIFVAHLKSARGHPIEIAMRPVEMEGLAPGEITGVRVDAVNRGRTCLVRALRDEHESGNVTIEAEVAGESLPTMVLPMPSRDDSELLSRLLIEARSDVMYPRSLALGAEMLSSARA